MSAAERICQGCRHQNRPAAHFCASCGADLSLAVVAEAAQQASADATAPQATEHVPPHERDRSNARSWLLLCIFLVASVAIGGVVWNALGDSTRSVRSHRRPMIAIEPDDQIHHTHHNHHDTPIAESDDLTHRWIRRIAQGAKDPYTVKKTVQRMVEAARRQPIANAAQARIEVRYEVPEANVHALQVALKSIDGELTFFYRDNRFTVEAAADIHAVIRRVVTLLDGYTIMKQVRHEMHEY